MRVLSGLLLFFVLVFSSQLGFTNKAEALSCSATISSPINFGGVDVLGHTSTTTQGLLTVICSVTLLDLGNLLLGIAVCPGIADGSGGSANNMRLLMGPGGTLQYQLYSDASAQTPWGGYNGNLLFGDAPLFRIPALQVGTVSQSWPIYAVLPGNQNLSTGQYLSIFNGANTQIRYGALGSLLGCSSLGAALSTTANFTVQATIESKCNLAAPDDVNFGIHGLLSTSVTAQGNIRLSCTKNTDFSVALETGGRSVTERRMKNGTNYVNYSLYKDSLHQDPWGEGATQIYSSTGTGVAMTLPVYGLVPAQTTPVPGVYKDTVIIKITY